MTSVYVFLVGAAAIVVVSLATVMLLRPHLGNLLDELCGSSRRAGFWAVVASLSIFLVGVLGGTSTWSYDGAGHMSNDLFFALVGQLRVGLIGVLFSVLAVAWLIFGFIRRFEVCLGPETLNGHR